MNIFKEGDVPKEQDQYRLFLDTYNYIVLTISYIESNTVWLSNSDSCYKYDRKTERLYKWCSFGYELVDTEHGFSKLSSEDVWFLRSNEGIHYSEFYGD